MGFNLANISIGKWSNKRSYRNSGYSGLTDLMSVLVAFFVLFVSFL